MKIASFVVDGISYYGELENNRLIACSEDFKKTYPSLKSVLQANIINVLQNDCLNSRLSFPLNEVTLLPPIPEPNKIICVGMNYKKEYPIQNQKVSTKEIILFSKYPDTLVGHNAAIEVPDGIAGNSLDYEGELAIIIGKPGRNIPTEEAMQHIFGYTIINDGSIRQWQEHSIFAGKNFSKSGSCGPYIITKNEVKNPENLRLTTKLNGIIVQETNTEKMIHSICKQLSYSSNIFTLNSGDIIATGSPDGTGASRIPKRFLHHGDQLEIEITGIGKLHNKILSRSIPQDQ